jgi:peptide chain release factor
VRDLPTQIQVRLDVLGVLVGEIEERFIRGSGPGGQKINKTSSTVCVRHVPSGTEVRCQRERSQAANREMAWAELCGKLEASVQAARVAKQQAVEKARRRARPKSKRQKARQVAGKRIRAEVKSGRQRGRANGE